MQLPRLRRVDRHDDGLNAWTILHVAPSPELAGLIRGYALYDERTGGFTTRRELPHAEAVMIVNLDAPIGLRSGDGTDLQLGPGEAFVAGAHLRPALSRSGGTQTGIHVFLSLAALRRLLCVPMTRLSDHVVRLDDILPGWLPAGLARLPELPAAQQVALLDTLLARRLAETRPLDPQTVHALRLLRDRPALDLMAVAAGVGWSRKHLAVRTRDVLGVGPCSYRRLLRFQHLTARLATESAPDWAGLAHACGYVDQSHLIREFGEFAGLRPTEFLRRRLDDGGGLVEG